MMNPTHNFWNYNPKWWRSWRK